MIRVKCAGIYKISIGDYYYIGMSVDIFGRWQSHYTNLVLNKHSSAKLQEMFNKIEDFRFEILEKVSKKLEKQKSELSGKSFDNHFRKLLLQKEKEWMKLHSINFALNKDDKHFS